MFTLNVIIDNVVTLSFCAQFVINLTETLNIHLKSLSCHLFYNTVYRSLFRSYV